MKERILKTEHAVYVPAQWDGINRSCIKPKNDAILVLPDVMPEKSTKGIFFDDSTRETHNLGATSGIVIAMGWRACEDWPEEERYKPGDRVIFNRYSGLVFWGQDNRAYRLMTDVSIAGEHDLPPGEDLEGIDSDPYIGGILSTGVVNG